jgi:hypothetical protein
MFFVVALVVYSDALARAVDALLKLRVFAQLAKFLRDAVLSVLSWHHVLIGLSNSIP